MTASQDTISDAHIIFETVCDGASVGMIIIDDKNFCLYMNSAAERVTGKRLVDIKGSCIDMSLPALSGFLGDDQKGWPTSSPELLDQPDGWYCPVSVTVRSITNSSGEGMIKVLELNDLSDKANTIASLELEKRTLQTLNRTGKMLAGTFDLEEIVQAVTDAATLLSGAQFGAFFYNVVREGREIHLYTLSGASFESFAHMPQPRHTQVFKPTFVDAEVVRVADIKSDPRYGKNLPFKGMPDYHLPVSSYLSVPVLSRSGEILGALVFGHENSDVFTESAEQTISAIAAQAAIAIDNSHLFHGLEREVVERQRAEDHQKLLVQELNHRVKNMLATVSSVATQTFRRSTSEEVMRTFQGRLMALSTSHGLIMRSQWRDVELSELAATALLGFADTDQGGRATFSGPDFRLSPRAALALGMGFHELATNAVKYGALGERGGNLKIEWSIEENGILTVEWSERGGPTVQEPACRGFGSRLLEDGIAHELGGDVDLVYEASGFSCTIKMDIKDVAA
ncbi:HWE histidine kinase domain-containing protein [Loktanella sp. DJP18]|uniref:HWE histidine kinase domain-containing protein n=1 Tax=Loktanella sp. DJP18 TaxID=3409788 RepID=UPI003BB55DFE